MISVLAAVSKCNLAPVRELTVFKLKIVTIEDFLKCTLMGKLLRLATKLYTCSPPLLYAVSLLYGLYVRMPFTRTGLLTTSHVEHASSRIQLVGISKTFPYIHRIPTCFKTEPVRVMYGH